MFKKQQSFITDEIESGFGMSIDCNGTHIVVGSPKFDIDRGEVRVIDVNHRTVSKIYEGYDYKHGFGNTVAYCGGVNIGSFERDITSNGKDIVATYGNNVSIGNLRVNGSLAAVCKYFCAVWCERKIDIYGYIMLRWQPVPIFSFSCDIKPTCMTMTEKFLYIANNRLVEVYQNGNDKEWELVNVLHVDYPVTCMTSYNDFLVVGTNFNFHVFMYGSSRSHIKIFMDRTDGRCASLCMHRDKIYVGQPDALHGDGIIDEYVLNQPLSVVEMFHLEYILEETSI